MLFGIFIEKKHKMNGLRAADVVGKSEHGRWTRGGGGLPGTSSHHQSKRYRAVWEECGEVDDGSNLSCEFKSLVGTCLLLLLFG